MKVAICSPCTLALLADLVDDSSRLPKGMLYPFAAYLIREYIRLGHHVTLVTNSFDCQEVMCFKGEHLCVVTTPRRARARAYARDFYRDEVRVMRDELLRAAPNIIHAQWTYEFADAALATGLPVLVTARDSPWRIAWIMKHPYRWIRAFYAVFWILPRAKHLTAVSDYLRRELRWLHGYGREITVIPNGITSARFCDAPKYGFKHRERLRVYCVCEWGRHKNVSTLLKAFALVRKRVQNVELVLVGRQLGMQEEGFNWARQQNLVDGVLFRGYLDQESIMRALRDDADLFISPTIEESLGMIFVEAMSQGVACVGGRKSGAVPWVLDNGRTGFLANVMNSEQLADTLIEVLSDPASVAHMAEQGQQRARKLFTLEAVAQSYVREYERVLDQSHNEQKNPRVM